MECPIYKVKISVSFHEFLLTILVQLHCVGSTNNDVHSPNMDITLINVLGEREGRNGGSGPHQFAGW